jgi:hypothetical protein
MIPLCTLGLFAVLAFPFPAAAQDAPAAPAAPAVAAGPAGDGSPVEKPKAGDGSEAVARLTLAARLAEQGRRSGSPLALAAAAELYAGTGVKEVDRPKTSEDGGGNPAGDEPASAPAADAAALYAEAAEAARAAYDEAMAEYIEKLASAAGSRQALTGAIPEGHRDRVDPRATDVYDVTYRGGKPARASVIASGNYDLDLYVYGVDGRLVAFDNDDTSVGICSWFPGSTSDYSLKVKNNTDAHVGYVIFTD